MNTEGLEWAVLVGLVLAGAAAAIIWCLRAGRRMMGKAGILREEAKPLRRSGIFWCGPVVLGFLLGWGVDSHRMVSRVSASQSGSDRYWSMSVVWLPALMMGALKGRSSSATLHVA